MYKCKKCYKKVICFLGKSILFAAILFAFYKLPSLLADKWFYYNISRRDYRQILED